MGDDKGMVVTLKRAGKKIVYEVAGIAGCAKDFDDVNGVRDYFRGLASSGGDNPFGSSPPSLINLSHNDKGVLQAVYNPYFARDSHPSVDSSDTSPVSPNPSIGADSSSKEVVGGSLEVKVDSAPVNNGVASSYDNPITISLMGQEGGGTYLVSYPNSPDTLVSFRTSDWRVVQGTLLELLEQDLGVFSKEPVLTNLTDDDSRFVNHIGVIARRIMGLEGALTSEGIAIPHFDKPEIHYTRPRITIVSLEPSVEPGSGISTNAGGLHAPRPSSSTGVSGPSVIACSRGVAIKPAGYVSPLDSGVSIGSDSKVDTSNFSLFYDKGRTQVADDFMGDVRDDDFDIYFYDDGLTEVNIENNLSASNIREMNEIVLNYFGNEKSSIPPSSDYLEELENLDYGYNNGIDASYDASPPVFHSGEENLLWIVNHQNNQIADEDSVEGGLIDTLSGVYYSWGRSKKPERKAKGDDSSSPYHDRKTGVLGERDEEVDFDDIPF